MQRVLSVGRALFVLVPLLTISPRAQAVAPPTYNRVFVGSNGNDANNCSSAATPCLGFAGAMAQVQPGGEVIALTTGGFGPIPTITQSVTISSAPGVVAFTGWPVTVNAPGATVVLRGLTIDGTGQTGNGITVTSVSILHVESCVITGWAGSGASGSGILVSGPGQLFVKDTIVRGNDWVGIWVNPTTGTSYASIDRCRLETNGWGFVPDSNNGGTAIGSIRDSVVSGNTQQGLSADGAFAQLNAEGCLVANNNVGLSSTGTLRASNCTVTGNQTGLGGGTILSRGNNTVEGNITADGTFSGPYSAK